MKFAQRLIEARVRSRPRRSRIRLQPEEGGGSLTEARARSVIRDRLLARSACSRAKVLSAMVTGSMSSASPWIASAAPCRKERRFAWPPDLKVV